MKAKWTVAFCLCASLFLPPTAEAASWKALLKQGKRLEKMHQPEMQRKAATLLFKAHQLAPGRFQTLEGASHACNIMARLSKKKSAISKWGKRGAAYATKMIKRWPSRAEGYFWASVNFGQYARGGGVWVAITKGLAGKIEKMALASYKRNPRLYKGAAQRVLGRYYFRVPWPMRNLNKSLRFLEQAYRMEPKLAFNQYFLAETLWAKGKKSRAVRLYRSCASFRSHTGRAKTVGYKCHKWLKKHGK